MKNDGLNSKVEAEKNYWALILMAKYVQEATEWNEKEFIDAVYKDYRLIEKLHNDFGIMFKNRDDQNLREQFCEYYGLF